MKIIEWEKVMESMSIDDIEKLINAINTLRGWDVFRREYAGHGLGLLVSVLSNARDQKQRIANA